MNGADEGRVRSRTTAVIGAKGGVGTTLVAVNLAALFADRARTLLVDLDFGKGDVGGYLDMWPKRSMHDVLDAAPHIDATSLGAVAARHTTGLHAITQPLDLTELVAVQATEVRALLDAAASGWEEVVLDCGSRVDIALLTAAARADRILLLTTPDVPSLRDALRVRKLLDRVGVLPAKMRLAVNRWPLFRRLELDEIEARLELPVAGLLPLDEELCWRAAHRGQLLRDLAPHSRMARRMARLVEALDDEDAVSTEDSVISNVSMRTQP